MQWLRSSSSRSSSRKATEPRSTSSGSSLASPTRTCSTTRAPKKSTAVCSPSTRATKTSRRRSSAHGPSARSGTILVDRYVQEATGAADPRLKASLLVSAAETAYRYGRAALAAEKGSKKKLTQLQSETITRLEEALKVDPKNKRAGALLERIYREAGKWEEVAAILETVSTESTVKEDKTAGFLRLARVLAKKIKSPERAVAAYERVVDLAPGNPEATSFLVDFFTEREMWDHLVSLYDEQLSTSARHGTPDIGMILQIAMVNWKMRGKPDAAEPYFERLRKAEPAHPGMLAFFREILGARNDLAKLTQILTDAQRALPDGKARTQLAAEVAKLSEEGANATKAIEQWRALLRQDPQNQQARDSLKRLYTQTGAYAPLAELLRGELERIPANDAEARLPLLREIAGIYREHVKSDSSLLAALTQIFAARPERRRRRSRARARLRCARKGS